VAIDKDRRDVRRVDEVAKVVVPQLQFVDRARKLLVDRVELPVQRFQLSLAGLQRVARRAQLFVDGVQMCDSETEIVLDGFGRAHTARQGHRTTQGRYCLRHKYDQETHARVITQDGPDVKRQHLVLMSIPHVRIAEHDGAAPLSGLGESGPQLSLQISMNHTEDVARWLSFGYVEIADRTLRDMKQFVILCDDERWRGVLLQQLMPDLHRKTRSLYRQERSGLVEDLRHRWSLAQVYYGTDT
jgi:hypothetical protein